MESVKVSKICQTDDEVMENIAESLYFYNARNDHEELGERAQKSLKTSAGIVETNDVAEKSQNTLEGAGVLIRFSFV